MLTAQPHVFLRRTATGFSHRVKLEFACREYSHTAFAFTGNGAARAMGKLLLIECCITFAELVIRNIGINLLFMQVLHVGFVGIAGIGRYHRTCLIDIAGQAQAFKAFAHAV